MKVRRLIEILRSIDPEALVIIDGDGGYRPDSPLQNVNTEMMYVPKDDVCGDTYFIKLPEHLDEFPEAEYKGEGGVKCITLIATCS